MTPYADFLYFGVSLYALLPAALLGWLKRFTRIWLVFATLGMLAVQYWQGGSGLENKFWLMLGYATLQWLNARLFLKLRAQKVRRPAFYFALLVALLPLLAGKFFPGDTLVFVGLSYITFRSLDVLFGIQDGGIQALPLAQYSQFLLFFATISSGPIDRFQRFGQDWRRERTSAEWLRDIDGGIQRIFTGFLFFPF